MAINLCGAGFIIMGDGKISLITSKIVFASTSNLICNFKTLFFFLLDDHICRPSWISTHIFLIVETKRRLLCFSHSKSLEISQITEH